MKSLALIPVLIFTWVILGLSQSNFDPDAYYQFLSENQNLTYQNLVDRFPLHNRYYKFSTEPNVLHQYLYFDSVRTKFNLTSDELTLLRQNHFVVTERLSFNNFVVAFHNVYNRDLPVFITTDAILQALHASYDLILSDVELGIMKPNLQQILDGLYSNFHLLQEKYESNPELQTPLKDVDLYVTIARSLIENNELAAHLIDQSQVNTIWQAIQNEQAVQMKLFSDHERWIDFSQFTVRGHYHREGLPEYFKAMMWLGRIGFFLTPPPENPWEIPLTDEEIKRMNLAAFMLDELLDLSGVRPLLDQNDQIINFLVGQSDNLTPTEYAAIKSNLGLNDAGQLLDDETYDAYISALKENNNARPKILSQILMLNPFSSHPDALPVTFLLSGQRFIIDSYIFSNVVYDRIIYENKKIWRPLPDPLDAMFVLGNNDALYLLKDEIEKYKYASQLNALRYLVESYDETFWQQSLYNVWLNAIRALNPNDESTIIADFLNSAAWHQCKINTQLASWAQLRHDNLLYAKQSYTGAWGCSFPYSFVEPNPEFFACIAQFAHLAGEFFNQFPNENNWIIEMIQQYFPKLEEITKHLEELANKELQNIPFSVEDQNWLKKMLFKDETGSAPPYSGWYADLYYNPWATNKNDFVIADVHTQPTDQAGNMVGHVLHVATGKINLGIFLVRAPYEGHPPMAFVGPLMSFYQEVTSDFKRLTDEEWLSAVKSSDLPERPDWVNLYLADSLGQQRPEGRELPSTLYTNIDPHFKPTITDFELFQNYPNPFNSKTTVRFWLRKSQHVRLSLFDVSGHYLATLLNKKMSAGLHTLTFDGNHLSSGIYLLRIQTANGRKTIKIVLAK